MLFFKKLRTEVLVALSMIGLKSAKVHRNGHTYNMPLIHGVGRWLFIRNDAWRRKVLSTIKHPEACTVIDVGVNVGQSLLDFHEVLPNATYIGIEPNPACVFYLNELIRTNSLSNMTILPFGLNEKREILSLMSKGWDDASSSVVDRKGTYYETKIYTLPGDDLIEELGLNNLRFIKIDVEGFELSVIKGLQKTIKKHQPVIFCEINKSTTNQNEFFEFVSSLDYEMYAEQPGHKVIKINSLPFADQIGSDYVLIHLSKSEDWLKDL